MRTNWNLAALVALAGLGLAASAQAGNTVTSGAAVVQDGGDYCDPCANGGGGRHGLLGHHGRGKGHGRGRNQNLDGGSPYYNCGCNGSYKFPVPPLYTYHWPGMFSQQLMTDYHSPWRFPPLRPYIDEVEPAAIMPATPPALEPGVLPPVAPPPFRPEGPPRAPAEDFSLRQASYSDESDRPALEPMSLKMERFLR